MRKIEKKNVSKENLEPKIHFKALPNETKAPWVTKELYICEHTFVSWRVLTVYKLIF